MQMKKKEFKNLNKRELIDLIYTMTEQNGTPPEDLPSAEEVRQERNKLRYRSRFGAVLKSTASVLIVVAAAAVLISTLFLPVIQVSGSSMEPALSNGDILLLLKTRRYEQGELCCISWQNKMLLKRVIGMPGDSISIDADGTVFINGQALDEPYVQNKCLGECDIAFPYTVPDGTLFIMGDQRDTSIDSRSSVIGCVEYDQMIGKVLFKIWSAS